jgi:hypothetical protein
MLLPDNIHPDNSIYYNGAFVLQSLQVKNNQTLLELYHNVKALRNISFSIFILCLDWLYLIDAAKINDRGEVKLCL